MFVNNTCFSGSKHMPPQCIPPTLPGVTSVPLADGGVNIPLFTYLLILSSASFFSSGVGPQASLTDTCCNPKGFGNTGNGCVCDVTSPLISEAGTSLSSTGNKGFPVV